MFAVVQYWNPSLKGIERGRAFERVLYRYCETRQIRLAERAGSRTFCGEKSASGFFHEQDAVLTSPSFSVHMELKHLSTPLEKNELLVFSHKGLDFLLGGSTVVRSVPMFRIILSGSLLSQEARRFALQWGITAIEPERIPFPLLHYLSLSDFPGVSSLPSNCLAEMREVLPAALKSAQEVIQHFSGVLSGTTHPIVAPGCDRILNVLQSDWGDRIWAALDEGTHGDWLEERYDALDRELFLDNI
ncbi:MAG: hypothetical protein ACLQVJ_10130 [Syntrophobacteraceae bacterium]